MMYKQVGRQALLHRLFLLLQALLLRVQLLRALLVQVPPVQVPQLRVLLPLQPFSRLHRLRWAFQLILQQVHSLRPTFFKDFSLDLDRLKPRSSLNHSSRIQLWVFLTKYPPLKPILKNKTVQNCLSSWSHKPRNDPYGECSGPWCDPPVRIDQLPHLDLAFDQPFHSRVNRIAPECFHPNHWDS